MPWTLYRYILWDLIKQLAIATAVLVFVISFAVAIKPLSDGLLGPVTLVKFVLYTAPTMLQFALPFSGAFASTMVFCRLRTDNEILACSASGMSYRKVLLPMVVLGLALMLGMFYLSNWVVPRYFALASRTLESDVAQMFVAKLAKHEEWQLPNSRTVIYADSVQEQILPPEEVGQLDLRVDADSPAPRWIQLTNAVVAQFDAQGWLEKGGTAQVTDAFIYRANGQLCMVLRPSHFGRFDSIRNAVGETWAPPVVRLPSFLRDKPQFLSWPDLTRLRQTPERYAQIRDAKAGLASALSIERILQLLETSLRTGPRRVTLKGPLDEVYDLRGPLVERRGDLLLLQATSAEAVVIDYSAGTTARRDEARGAEIEVQRDEMSPEPRIHIKLLAARAYEQGHPERGTEHPVLALPALAWPENIQQPLSQDSLRDLLDRAHRSAAGTPKIAKAAKGLESEQTNLYRKIVVQLHQRAAAAVTGLFVLLLGAVLSILFKNRTPLVVFLFSFLVATLTVIVAQSGGTFGGNSDYPLALGLSIIWAGIGLMIGATAWGYVRMARN